MKPLSFFLVVSFLIHAAVIWCLFHNVNPERKKERALLVDLSLIPPAKATPELPSRSEARPSNQKKEARNLISAGMPANNGYHPENPKLFKPQPHPVSVSPPPAASYREPLAPAEIPAHEVKAETKSVQVQLQPPLTTASVPPDGSIQRKYLKEHFSYIRDIIHKNLRYPEIARKMGWNGDVVASFEITGTGRVRELKIIRSSGHAVLDRTVIETIRSVEPFPAPPAPMTLIVPISFSW
jgi:periplasmic protein TonB